MNGSRMTSEQYREALSAVGLTPSGQATADLFGVSIRTIQNWAAGDRPVPTTTALTLRMMIYSRWSPDFVSRKFGDEGAADHEQAKEMSADAH